MTSGRAYGAVEHRVNNYPVAHVKTKSRAIHVTPGCMVNLHICDVTVPQLRLNHAGGTALMHRFRPSLRSIHNPDTNKKTPGEAPGVLLVYFYGGADRIRTGE